MDNLEKAINKTVVDAVQSTTTSTNSVSSSATATTLTRTLSAKDAYKHNIHVRKSIDSNAQQISKCKLVFYSRTTDSIIEDGELVRLMRRPSMGMSTQSYIYKCMSWFDLLGEFDVFAYASRSIKPSSLIVLDPERLKAKPYSVRNYEQLTGWQYYDQQLFDAIGASIDIPVENIIHATNFNPDDNIRGLSPVLSGQHEISTNFFISKYNASYFQNGANADLIVRFPKGTSQKVAEEWVEKWQASHGLFEGNGFRISAMIGDDMQIETPNESAKDGKFLELRTLNAEDVIGIWGVPPSVMGFLSRTRFDTIDVELESYAENTLMPRIEVWNQTHQTQLVDRWFPKSSGTEKSIQKGFKHLKKNCRIMLEKALDENPKSEVVMCLDPDTLPIMQKLLLTKVKVAKQISEDLFTSKREACEFVGIELEENPIREQIYIPSGYQLASMPQEQPKVESVAQPEDVEEEEMVDSEDVAEVKSYYRSIRKTILEGMDKEGTYSKDEVFKAIDALKLNEYQKDKLRKEAHRDFVTIVRANDKEVTKKHLNNQSKNSTIKAMLKE